MPRVPDIAVTTSLDTARTPFQNVRPADTSSFGRGLQTFGNALQNAAGAVADYAEEEDRRALLQIEQEEQELAAKLLTDPESGVQALRGSARLEAIRGERPQPGDAGDGGVMGRYEQAYSKIAERRGDLQTAKGRAAADLYTKSSKAAFQLKLNKLEIEAQNEADAQLLGSRVAHIHENTLSFVGTEAQDAAMAKGLQRIKDTVTDPIMGLAKVKGITDKSQIELLVKTEQGRLVSAAIQQLAAGGQAIAAKKMLDSAMAKGGVLQGTEEGTKLMAAVQKMSDLQVATDKFEGLLQKHGMDNPGAVYLDILKIDDANLQARMMTQWSSHNSAMVSIKKHNLQGEMTYFMEYVAENGSTDGMDFTRVPELMATNPTLIIDYAAFGTKALKRAGETALSEDVEAHVSSGGGLVGSRSAFRAMESMAATDPDQFMTLMGNPQGAMKRLLNVEQWGKLQQKVTDIKVARSGYAAGPATDIRSSDVTDALRTLGIRDDAKDTTELYDYLIRDQGFRAAVQQKRIEVYAQTGKPATEEHIAPVVARFALKVRGEIDGDGGEYHLYELGTIARDHGQVRNLPIALRTRASVRDPLSAEDALALQVMFGVPKREIMDAANRLLDANKAVTINNLSSYLVVQPRGFPETEAALNEIDDAALRVGLQPEFVSWLVSEHVGKDLTAENTLRVLHDYENSPASMQRKAFDAWQAAGGG